MTLPLTKEMVKPLKIGDVLELNGDLYTARDAAHKRLAETIARGEKTPIDLQNQTIFYTGPCPAKPGRQVGSIGPTTSLRMDVFVETMFQQGMVAMIGKGDRTDEVARLCRQYSGVYLLGIGGASAITTRQIKSVVVIAYEDLGTESIKQLTVENLRVIVGIDTQGRVLQTEEIKKYRRG